MHKIREATPSDARPLHEHVTAVLSERLATISSRAEAVPLESIVAGEAVDAVQMARRLSDTWQRFESDLRSQHLTQEATLVESNDFGRKYEIRARLGGALGAPQMIVSIWFIPKDGDTPRFVTAYPGDSP